jgi:hypothetical protein
MRGLRRHDALSDVLGLPLADGLLAESMPVRLHETRGR